MYHGKLKSLAWDAILVPRLRGTNMAGRIPAKTSGVYLGYLKAFLLSAELSRTDIDASITC